MLTTTMISWPKSKKESLLSPLTIGNSSVRRSANLSHTNLIIIFKIHVFILQAQQLISLMLTMDAEKRPSAEAVLEHSWLKRFRS